MATDKEKWEAYLYPGTDVLINKFNIQDQEKLQEVESTITFEKLLELGNKEIKSKFDKEYFISLHEFIFGDIYPFAGKYRTVNMAKLNSFFFIKDDNAIDEYLNTIFRKAKIDLDSCHTRDAFAKLLADLYVQLIYCHPFREGNGRTIREFVREFSIANSKLVLGETLELDWRLIDREELNKYIQVAHMYPDATALLFRAALVPNNEAKISREDAEYYI